MFLLVILFLYGRYCSLFILTVMSFLTKRLSFTSELRYLSLEDGKNSHSEEQEPQGTLSGPRRRSRARLGGLSDVDQLNDLIQRHEMDTANLPNVEEAETKGKTAEKTPQNYSNTAAQKIYAVSF